MNTSQESHTEILLVSLCEKYELFYLQLANQLAIRNTRLERGVSNFCIQPDIFNEGKSVKNYYNRPVLVRHWALKTHELI